MPDRPARAVLLSALSPAIARRSAFVALLVGTILNLINQGDTLLRGGDLNWVKIVLTYAVPFCVATYGAYSAIRSGAAASGTDDVSV